MFHMKTASVRELRQDFAKVLEWVTNGEEVEITKRREAVAKLVPLHRKKIPRKGMPDIAARLKKAFGARIIPDTRMNALLEQNKGIF